MNKRETKLAPLLVTILLPAAVLVLMREPLQAWAGDAVIHLRVAELCARGQWFEFNAGEPVVATSSLLWTLLLTVLFRLFSSSTVPWVVKGILILLWYLSALRTKQVWSRAYSSQGAGLFAFALFVVNPGVFQNSANGMEAILAALTYLECFRIAFVSSEIRENTCFAILCVLSLVASLVRPEGILFCLALAAFVLWHPRIATQKAFALLLGALLGTLITLLVAYSVTGSFVPDAALARRAAALRSSYLLGPVALHPNTILRLLAYFPVTAGLIVAGALILHMPSRESLKVDCLRHENSKAAVAAAVVLVGVMVFFYTFVVGASHTSRYWIPYFPLFFGAGGGMVYCIVERMFKTPGTSRGAGVTVALICFGWFLGVYSIEYRLRALQGFGYGQKEIVEAPSKRHEFTRRYLEQLGYVGGGPIKVALTEVQVRYFLDDDGRVEIFSLDGRTAPNFAKYLEPGTGRRKFDYILMNERPDFVELGQFAPSEPLLPEVERLLAEGKDRVQVGGFRFEKAPMPGMVRFLGTAADAWGR